MATSFLSATSDEFRVGPEFLAERSELTSIVMQIIASWSYVDMSLTRLAVLLLNAEPVLAISMLQSIVGEASQRRAVQEMAKFRLDEEGYLLFKATFAVIETRRQTRNDYAHGVWGIRSSEPDSLILWSPKELTKTDARSRAAEQEVLVRFRQGDCVFDDVEAFKTAAFQVVTKSVLDAELAKAKLCLMTSNELATMIFMFPGAGVMELTRQNLFSDGDVRAKFDQLSRWQVRP